MRDYWITVSVPAVDLAQAEAAATTIAADWQGRVVQVDDAPPQGSIIVGDFREDDPLLDDDRR